MSAPPFDMEKRVAQFVALRDKKKEIKDRHEAELAPYNTALETLGNLILQYLLSTNQENAKAKSGTAHKITRKSATIADVDAFRRYVIGSEAWDLLDFKANAPAVEQFIKENQSMPPGVNYSERIELGVRRK